MTPIKTLLFAAMVAGVAACSSDDIVISGFGAGALPYDPSFVRYVMSQGDFPLEVHGNPSGLADDVFSDLVEQSLRIDPAFGTASFRTEPTVRNQHGFRVVLVFNADNTRLDPRRICRGEGLDKAGAPNVILHVRGAFCERDELLSTNTALAEAPSDFRDDKFRKILFQLTFEMMPSEGNRELNEDCRTPNCV